MIKIIFISLIGLILSGSANSQMSAMTPNQIKIMEQCTKNIDLSAVNRVENRGVDLAIKIRALCFNGKRDEAESVGRSFDKEVWNSKELKTVRICTNKALNQSQPNNETIHICDGKYNLMLKR